MNSNSYIELEVIELKNRRNIYSSVWGILFGLSYSHNRAKRRILRFDKQQDQPNAVSDDAAAKAKSGPYKRVGGTGANIHRLSDKGDSDDENNTWNGNSTQQQ